MPKTILFVDDDDTVRELGTAILESAGHAVKAARDGREGLALIEDDPSIDVLLTDIVMPGGIDGWALADKAKRIRPDLKVLYTSGYVPRLPSSAHGMVHGPLLAKPWRRQQLLDHLERVSCGG
jgi:CheY-like chemotaxis protein